MHGQRRESAALAKAIAAHNAADAAVVLCPPATLLTEIAAVLAGSPVALGGQDCHFEASGAHTGDISPLMLKDAGCAFVIVGHSERRHQHGETDALVAKKAAAAIAAGLIPIICVGENLAEREAGRQNAVVEAQLKGSALLVLAGGQALVAYEPVWAIGTGKTAGCTDIALMHKHIASVLACATSGGRRTPVLYGGSVKAEGAAEIFRTEGVDGVLVGGASLKAEEFCAIISAAEHKK